MPPFQRVVLTLALLLTPPAFTPAWAQSAPPSSIPITDAKSWHAALMRQVLGRTQFPDLPQPPLKEGEVPPPLPSGQVTVKFVLNRDGRLLSSGIAQSSGRSEFDRAALDSLKLAEPFPKPPAAVPGESFTFQLPIHFRAPPPAPAKPAAKPEAKPAGKPKDAAPRAN